jgi:hypothetical protein
MDIFTWSIPFVLEKITEILNVIINLEQNSELLNDEDDKKLKDFI